MNLFRWGFPKLGESMGFFEALGSPPEAVGPWVSFRPRALPLPPTGASGPTVRRSLPAEHKLPGAVLHPFFTLFSDPPERGGGMVLPDLGWVGVGSTPGLKKKPAPARSGTNILSKPSMSVSFK